MNCAESECCMPSPKTHMCGPQGHSHPGAGGEAAYLLDPNGELYNFEKKLGKTGRG